MQEIVASVIIPAYNAGKYLDETVKSVIQQSFKSWEIIIVNDGSGDNTAEVAGKYTGDHITLINQPNAGVSAARNRGMSLAKGEYLLFLDADDLLTCDFLLERVKILSENANAGYIGGLIETFPVKTFPRKAAATNPEKEILFFLTDYATVPSNYLFRKSVLQRYDVRFNTELSSTADRFFILQLAKYTPGIALESEKGKLLYRISDQSMSHQISPGLIRDNEKFYYEIRKAGLMPATGTGRFKSTYFFSLALGFGKIRKWNTLLKYLTFSFLSSPVCFLRLFFSRIRRKKNAVVPATAV